MEFPLVMASRAAPCVVAGQPSPARSLAAPERPESGAVPAEVPLIGADAAGVGAGGGVVQAASATPAAKRVDRKRPCMMCLRWARDGCDHARRSGEHH